MVYTLAISEFFADILEITNFLNNDPNLTDDSFLRAAVYMCHKHIKKSGRLIDTDLHTYVDLLVTSKYPIWFKIKNYQVTDAEATSLWTQITNFCMQSFEDHIFLVKYDKSNLLQPKPYLVKLKP